MVKVKKRKRNDTFVGEKCIVSYAYFFLLLESLIYRKIIMDWSDNLESIGCGAV